MQLPVKLLEPSNNRNALLNMIGENATIDKHDYIESRILTSARALKLLAIENGSKIAIEMVQPLFEKIADAIHKECGCTDEVRISCKLTSDKIKIDKGRQYIHLGADLGEVGGHYSALEVDHDKKTVRMIDSMGKYGLTKQNFMKFIRKHFKSYKFNDISEIKAPQPTGGFVLNTPEEFRNAIGMNVSNLAFEISQYDELSQHHFCFIESFVAIAHRLLGTPYGPLDPRDRLVFIKRVLWGLLHRFYMNKKGPLWKYFHTNFPYYMKVTDSNNKPLKLNRHIVLLPSTTNTSFHTHIVPISMPDVNSTTSIYDIIIKSL
jgi:hypothetical protein